MFDAEQLTYMKKHGLTWRDAYDYPMSWDWWRHYSVYHAATDPGPCEPPEHSIEELDERITVLEEQRQPSARSKEKPKPELTGGVKL